MCGIAGIYLKDPDEQYLSQKEIEDTVDWLFCGIENRGTHASGVAVQTTNGEHYLEKSDMPASKFIFWRRDIPSNPRIILQHTRWATKGKPENLLNNHPIAYENVIAIHNGHISNDDELFESESLNRIAEVDSEIIPALLHKYTFENPKEALEKMIGGFAIAAIDDRNPGTLLLAKGTSSPLVFIETDGMFMWASEQKFLEDALLYGMGYESKPGEFHNVAYGRYALINGDEMTVADFSPAYKTYVSTPYASSWADRSVSVPTGGEYRAAEGWYDMNARDKCDECFIWYPAYQLNKHGNDRYCDHCEVKLFDILPNGTRVLKSTKKLSRKERKRQRREAARKFQESKRKAESAPKEVTTIADALDQEHWHVCELVANHYGTKKEFVDFLLFSDHDIEDYDDANLMQMFLEFQDKYQEFLTEVSADTDNLMETIGIANELDRAFLGL